MFRIEDNVIYITRGDNATIHVNLADINGRPYRMAEGDELKLTVKDAPSHYSEVQLMITSANNDIAILPQHTKTLEIGQYSCDIQLTTYDGYIYTVFPNYENPAKLKTEGAWNNFWVTPGVSE